uniref:Uncharacterized protein n=1 Tax=Oryza brachyantha TaxID=4533 RepID=J3M7Y7_ORYBR
MATRVGCQTQAPAMPPAAVAAERAGGGGREARALLPPPRRGQIKEQIVKDLAAAVSRIFSGLARSDKSGAGAGAGGVPVSDDTDDE